MTPAVNPDLDLVFERVVDVSPELVWRAWTEPERLMKWFTPAPWQTVACRSTCARAASSRRRCVRPKARTWSIRPAAISRSCPTGAWSGPVGSGRASARTPPRPGSPTSAARLTFEPQGQGTRYVAHVMHTDAGGREKHEKMGFHDGWGAALDQLVALYRHPTKA